jgi:dTDP-4-dehydrorhamnose reductase
MIKSIIVTGKNGQLGQSIQKISKDYPQYEFTFVSREQLDFACSKSIDEFFAGKQFDVLINCAAYTAVDNAELDQVLANQVNHLAVRKLAMIAKKKAMQFIHVSTDYVFSGKHFRPYQENDLTDPQSIYGMTKLEGEKAMQAISPVGTIIRTSWVYSEFGNNFVKTMLCLGKERSGLGVVFDQVGSPTYALDLAQACLSAIENSKSHGVEIYHYSNEGVCSWYDFAKAIFEFSNTHCRINPIETKDFPTPAKRPYYSLMNKSKIRENLNLDIPYWRDSLVKCLSELKKKN